MTPYQPVRAQFDRRRGIRSVAVPGALALASVALALGGEPVRLLARYDRSAVAEGELWRLLTGHLVHLGWGHLSMNLIALAALTLLFVRALGPGQWLSLAASAALAIDVGLYLNEPSVAWYVGLSGLLHGLWAGGALQELPDPRSRPIGLVLLLSLLAKLGWEWLEGPVPFTAESAGGPVIVAAHLYGALGGLVWFVADRIVHGLRLRQL